MSDHHAQQNLDEEPSRPCAGCRGSTKALVSGLAFSTLFFILVIVVASRRVSPRSSDVAGWVVDVDDNRRGRSPCSGIKLARGRVLTAKHCLSADPYVRFDSRHSFIHARVESDVLDRDLLLLKTADETADAHGYVHVAGPTTDLFLKFAKLWSLTRAGIVEAKLVEADESFITVTAPRTSLCFGDSGSPLLVGSSTSSLRVLGVLSGGDPQCDEFGLNRYVRVDQVPELEAFRKR